MSETLLQVENLRTYFHTFRGVVKAVDGISFSLDEGQVLGIVGNGSSITTLAEAGIDPVEGDFECAVKDGTLVLRSDADTNVYEMMKLSLIHI